MGNLRVRGYCVVPEEISVGTLFQCRNTRSKGGNGFMSASDGVIFSCTSFHLSDTKVGSSPKLSSFAPDVVLGTPETCMESTLDPLKPPDRGIIIPLRRAAARRYVTLRSRRNVSRKKNTKRTRLMPRNAASSQKVARQLNACVSMPPRMGPSEGPSRGAA